MTPHPARRSPPRSSWRRVGTAALAGVVAALVTGAPAFAHAQDAPAATDYQTRIAAITPAMPGLSIRTVEAGARLELTNHTGRPIEVLGYDAEPYLEIRPDGVYENVNSPASYLNESLTGGTIPPSASPKLPPAWNRTSTAPVTRWHDHRTWWMSPTPPPGVQRDPTRPQLVSAWKVPLRDGVRIFELHGTLSWAPKPQAPVWLAGCLVLAAALATLALTRLPTAAFAPLLVVGGLAALTGAVGRAIDYGDAVATSLFLLDTWATITALGALAAAAYILARRPSAEFALALSGACLALFSGIPHLTTFAHGVAPAPWDGQWSRLLLATVVSFGAGTALAGALRLRAAARQAAATDAAAPHPA